MEDILQYLWRNANVALPLISALGVFLFCLILFRYFFITRFPRSKLWWIRTDYIWYSLAIISIIFAWFDLAKSEILEQESETQGKILSLAASLDSTVTESIQFCDVVEREIREARKREQLRRGGVIFRLPTEEEEFKSDVPEKFMLLQIERYDEDACLNARYIKTIIAKSRRSQTWPWRPTLHVAAFGAPTQMLRTWSEIMQFAPGSIEEVSRLFAKDYKLHPDGENSLKVIRPLEVGLIIWELNKITENYKVLREKSSDLLVIEPVTSFWPFLIALALALKWTKVTATIRFEGQ